MLSYHEHPIMWKVRRKLAKYICGKYDDTSCRILVILHLYYPEAWKEIRQYLYNLNNYKVDLYITYCSDKMTEEYANEIKKDYPSARLFEVPNKGFDLGPFFDTLNKVNLDDYQCIIKIHSKGTKRPIQYIYNQLFFRRSWFKDLFQGILSPTTVSKMLEIIINSSAPTIVAAKNLIIEDPQDKVIKFSKLAKSHGVNLGEHYQFVAGTCFAMSPSHAKAIKSLNYDINDFEDTEEDSNTDLAHLLERYICTPLSGELVIAGISVSSIRRVTLAPLCLVLKYAYPVLKRIKE